MPRGRFLNKEICIDKKVNELSSYESMLGFTWIIPHLDCNGLTYGDPAVVRSMIFPRRNDITVEQMESYIKEWQRMGLIKIYEKGDEKYIWFPNFAKHQIGLKKEREAKSGIPLPDEFPIDAGDNPDECGNNGKVMEGNGNGNSNVNGNSNGVPPDNNNPEDQLLKTFTDHTKLTPGADAEKIAKDLIKAGVTTSDIVNGINFLNNKDGFKCTSFQSVKNPAIIEMQRRTAKKKSGLDYDSFQSQVKIDPEQKKKFDEQFGTGG